MGKKNNKTQIVLGLGLLASLLGGCLKEPLLESEPSDTPSAPRPRRSVGLRGMTPPAAGL